MPVKRVFVGLVVILIICSSPELAPGLESESTISGQIVLPSVGGLKEPVLVLLDPFGTNKNNHQTLTDLRGHFEFHNIPQGSYYIRLRLKGFENVNYRVEVPGTTYVSIFLNGQAVSARTPNADKALSGSHIVDIRQLTARIPKQAAREYEAAVREMKNHNTQRAIERLEKSVRLAPEFYTARLYLAQEYRKADRLDAAEQEFVRASELNPREAAPLIQLGEIYLEKKNFERAAAVLERALGIVPGSAVGHYALGRARYSLSDYSKAEEAFKQAVFLDKDFEAPELMLLNVYLHQGRLRTVLWHVDELLQKKPEGSRNPTLEKFRSEVKVALAKSKQGGENQESVAIEDSAELPAVGSDQF